MVTIRQATLADKPAIYELLKITYPGRWQYKFPARWEWMFQNNPFWSREDPPVWIAVDEETGLVVGQSCALVEPLYLDGEVYPVGWGVDFYVREEWRRQGIGSRLQRANKAGHPVFMSLSMTPVSRKIKLEMGMQSLPPVPMYQRILRHAPESVLETLSKRNPTIAKIARALGLHILLAHGLTWKEAMHLPPVVSEKGGIQIEQIEQFDERIDRLWENAKIGYTGCIRQDAAFCNWKFIQQPDLHYVCFQALRDGEVCGIMVLRKGRSPERNMGILANLFAHPQDKEAIQALLRHAVRWFWDHKVTAVTAANSVPAIQKALLELGFNQTKTALPAIAFDSDLPETGWLFGRGDHDWDQYPLA